jgi:hypothetical protein
MSRTFLAIVYLSLFGYYEGSSLAMATTTTTASSGVCSTMVMGGTITCMAMGTTAGTAAAATTTSKSLGLNIATDQATGSLLSLIQQIKKHQTFSSV